MGGAVTGGVLVGSAIASRIQVTQLPQLVALFHSLVGSAAAATCLAEYMENSTALLETGGGAVKAALFLGCYIGWRERGEARDGKRHGL